MSRAATGDTVVVQPSNNVYTVLAAAALVCTIIALVAIFVRASTIFAPASGGSGGLM